MARHWISGVGVFRLLREVIDEQGRCLVLPRKNAQSYLGLGAWTGCVINITVKQGSYLHLGNVIKMGQGLKEVLSR